MDDLAQQPADERTSTSIATNVSVRGDIEGTTDLHVSGKVAGRIVVRGLVTDEKSEIEGSVIAEAAVVAGRIVGPLQAEAVQLKSTAYVEGDLTYTSLQIEAGARVLGRLIIAEPQDLKKPKLSKIEADPETDVAGEELLRMAARLRRAS